MIKVGSRVKDVYTGFSGIAIGRTEWLYGCARIGVESLELHDGKPIEPVWFDEQRLQVVEVAKPIVTADSGAPTGGPTATPKRHADPTR